MKPEVWKGVVGYEDLYEVSDLGRVRNIFTDRVLKPRQAIKYQHVALYKWGRATEHNIHRLVLAAFIGPCPEGHIGLHNDDNRDDNRASNLRYGTVQDNHDDQILNGTRGHRGPILPLGHAARVLDLCAAGIGPIAIGRYLNINRNLVTRIRENSNRYL